MGLICGLALAACKDNTGPRSLSVTLSVCSLGETRICPATTVLPLRALEVTAHVVPTGDVAVEQVVIQAAGVLVDARTFVADPPIRGPGTAVDTLGIPAALGTITLTATARGGGLSTTSGSVHVAVADTEPPVVEAVAVSPTDSLEPGDSLVVSVAVRDNALLDRIIAQASGAFSAAETLSVFGTQIGTFSVTFRVPPTAPFGGVASFAVHAIDIGGLTSNVLTAASPALRDVTAPVVTGAEPNGTMGVPLVPQDTFRVMISTTDNHQVAWVGYRVGEPVIAQDSVAVTNQGGTYVVTSPVTASWIGRPRVQPFARDSSGNYTAPDLFYELHIIDAVRRPSRRGTDGVTVLDDVYDAKRQALYILGGPGLGVVPLATMQYAALSNLPYYGISIDLTPSNDTLLMPWGRNLLIVDLTQSPPRVDSVPLVSDTLPGEAHSVLAGVAASNKALVTFDTGTATAWLLAHDFTSGQTQTRADAGVGGTITSHATLVPSIDRSRVALFWGTLGGETQEGQVYEVAGDGFTAHRSSVHFVGETAQSADSAGSRFLMGGVLHGPDLATLATFDYPSNPDYPGTLVYSAIAPDGQYAYFSQSLEQAPLIVKVRLVDNVVVERILAPAFASQLRVTPDGTTLIGIAGQDGVFVIDLR